MSNPESKWESESLRWIHAVREKHAGKADAKTAIPSRDEQRRIAESFGLKLSKPACSARATA
jgi:SpoVK/Ycf46/Vps4 family AAA+-type ATPase